MNAVRQNGYLRAPVMKIYLITLSHYKSAFSMVAMSKTCQPGQEAWKPRLLNPDTRSDDQGLDRVLAGGKPVTTDVLNI